MSENTQIKALSLTTTATEWLFNDVPEKERHIVFDYLLARCVGECPKEPEDKMLACMCRFIWEDSNKKRGRPRKDF